MTDYEKTRALLVAFIGIILVIVAAIFVLKGKPHKSGVESFKAAPAQVNRADNLNIFENKEFLAKSPNYPEAIRGLITGSGYECPRLAILSLSPEMTPMGTKLEALCGPRGSTDVYKALHYSVYPERLKVVVCKPFGVFGGGCD